MVHPCSQIFRGGGVVHPYRQMFKEEEWCINDDKCLEEVEHLCRQMFRGGSVEHPCRQMFRGGGVVHPCRQIFRGCGMVHPCRQMFRGGGGLTHADKCLEEVVW